jgi:hypothetical protein
MECFKYSGISDCSNSGPQGLAFNVEVYRPHDVNTVCNLLQASVPRDRRLTREIPKDRVCRNEVALPEDKSFSAH